MSSVLSSEGRQSLEAVPCGGHYEVTGFSAKISCKSLHSKGYLDLSLVAAIVNHESFLALPS